MQERIQKLHEDVQALSAQTLEEVEDLRIKYISKKGLIAQLFDEFKTVPNEEKRLVGQQLNQLKEATIAKINSLRDALTSSGQTAEDIDWPLPDQARYTSSSHARTARDLLYLCTPRLFHCRGSRGRG